MSQKITNKTIPADGDIQNFLILALKDDGTLCCIFEFHEGNGTFITDRLS
jgi:hypothetical protein